MSIIMFYFIGCLIMMEIWHYCFNNYLLKSKYMRSLLKLKNTTSKELLAECSEHRLSLDGMDFILLKAKDQNKLVEQTGGAFYYKYRHQVYIVEKLYLNASDEVLKAILAHEHCHKAHSDTSVMIEYISYLFREIRADITAARKYGAFTMLNALAVMASLNAKANLAKWSTITTIEKVLLVESFIFTLVVTVSPRVLALTIAGLASNSVRPNMAITAVIGFFKL